MEREYNVGDLYDVDGRKGIVFKVSDDGLHGLIISLDEVRLPWVSREFTKTKSLNSPLAVPMKTTER